MLHGPGDLRLEEVPDPHAGPGELVVRVDVALTCATDAKMLRVGAHPALGPLPAPLGHELAGTVVEAGAGAAGRAGGRRRRGRQLGPVRSLPRLRRGEGEPVRARIVYLTGRVRRARAVPAAIVARNVLPRPAALASAVYTRNKEKASNEVGMRGKLHRAAGRHDARPSCSRCSQRLNADDAVDGILVQLPLPKQIREQRVLDAIAPEQGRRRLPPDQRGPARPRAGRRSCRARRAACMQLLAEAGVELEGARAVVVGRSNIVGKPMAQLLLAAQRDRHDRALAHARPRRASAARPTCSSSAVGKAKLVQRRLGQGRARS